MRTTQSSTDTPDPGSASSRRWQTAGSGHGNARTESEGTLRRLRTGLLAIFVLGAAGVWIELLLLAHFEDTRQLVPLVLLPVSLASLVWHRVDRGPRSTRVLQVVMALLLGSGFFGLWFHYAGNVEFELEMYPSRQGFELFKGAMTGATPALAPGTMIHLGLLGLAYTYRHPFIVTAGVSVDPMEEET